MGLQFITMGLLGELLVRTYHESQGKPVYRAAAVQVPTTPVAARVRVADNYTGPGH
jgi:formylmethanofuran dehydrogenase subunit D